MANNGAHDTATTEPLDRATPDVSLDVAAVAAGAAGASVSGGNAALGFSANATTITINTDGTHDFGSTAPDFVCLIDAGAATDGSVSADNILLGAGASIVSGSIAVDANVSKHRGGKGIIIGGQGTDLGTESVSRLRISHPIFSEMFESRVFYYPAAHSAKAQDYFDGTLSDPHPGGSASNQAWQIKPVWHYIEAAGPYGTDTDFFITGFQRRAGNEFATSFKLSSNSVSTLNLHSDTEDGYSRITKDSTTGLPLDEVHGYEFGWNQGDIDNPSGAGSMYASVYSDTEGTHFIGNSTGLNLVEANGSQKSPDHFTYPGYVRGYPIEVDTHEFDRDLYMAGGPAKYARVAICSEASYFQAKQRIILKPNSWASTTSTFALRDWMTGLDDFSGWYVCLINASNVQIGTGVEI